MRNGEKYFSKAIYKTRKQQYYDGYTHNWNQRSELISKVYKGAMKLFQVSWPHYNDANNDNIFKKVLRYTKNNNSKTKKMNQIKSGKKERKHNKREQK